MDGESNSYGFLLVLFFFYFPLKVARGQVLTSGEKPRPPPLNDSPGSGSARMLQMFIRLAIMIMTMMLMMVMMKTVMSSYMIMTTMIINFECLFFCKVRFQIFCSVLQFGNFISECNFLLLL